MRNRSIIPSRDVRLNYATLAAFNDLNAAKYRNL